MTQKQTYEELERKIKKLEKEAIKRKQAEEKLRGEEALKTSILDSIPHAVIGFRERRITFANNGVEAVFGWKPEDLIGKNSRILYRTDEEYEEIGNRYYSDLESHQIYSDDVSVQHKDGRNMICRLTTARIGETLKEKGIVATFEDITTIKEAEEELRQSEEKHRTILKNIKDAISNR